MIEPIEILKWGTAFVCVSATYSIARRRDDSMTDYVILETEHFTVSQANGYRIPGYVIVCSKSPCTSVAELTPEQGTELARCLANAEELIQQIIKPERIYILKFGEANPRVHFHVFPRTRRITEAYLGEVLDKTPYSGARIIDWAWHHHETLGFTDVEIEAFVKDAKRNILKFGEERSF